jgi:hypothetical protein
MNDPGSVELTSFKRDIALLDSTKTSLIEFIKIQKKQDGLYKPNLSHPTQQTFGSVCWQGAQVSSTGIGAFGRQ